MAGVNSSHGGRDDSVREVTSGACGEVKVRLGSKVPQSHLVGVEYLRFSAPLPSPKGGEKIRRQKLEACLLDATKTEAGEPDIRTEGLVAADRGL